MQSLGRLLDDAQMAWLKSPINCCAEGEDAGSSNHLTPAPAPGESMRPLVDGQPQLVSPPLPQKLERSHSASPFKRSQSRGKEWIRSLSRASSRGSLALRRNLSRTSNRIVIGAPYNFQHCTDTGYVREPERATVSDSTKLRPLQLSICLPGNRLPPLPEFGPCNADGKNDRKLVHMRSESAIKFRIPRKPLSSTVRERRSMNTEELLNELANDSPRLRPTRLRANTEPLAFQRVKDALLENLELDKRLKELDEAIEGQSIRLASRSTSRASRVESRHERRESVYSEFTEPMPAIPQLQLHHSDHRPQTAPFGPRHCKSVDSAFYDPKLLKEFPPPPPLPLILQAPQAPPRRKSMSRVSSWLFPSVPGQQQHHYRHVSLDSVTNTPKAVTSKEGFYQCIDVEEVDDPQSVSSVSSMGSEVDGNEDYDATSWSESPSLGIGDRHANELGYVDSKKLQVALPGRTIGGSDKPEEARWGMAGEHGGDLVGVAL
ncbi:hypothetical protein DSL72_005621 [Monilinia vaccinii-corymbosi]|uniref:Uncharacterized protein n=1 Tax=Monilinia vaccinii-corymbosi TaxID=61207 RepID=A0A8A3PG92_9HELO|nr:hypothetical protein DSL72_005621 [Monilinia vaccinii-corymbosi]